MLLICERHIQSFTLRFFQGEEGDFYGHIILLPCYISRDHQCTITTVCSMFLYKLYTCTNADINIVTQKPMLSSRAIWHPLLKNLFYAPLPFDSNKMLLLLKLKMACLVFLVVTYFLVSNWLGIGRVNSKNLQTV